MEQDVSLTEEYWICKELISTLSFDHSMMPKDVLSRVIIRTMRENDNTKLKINHFDNCFKPLLDVKENRVSKYKKLIHSQEVLRLLSDKDVKRYLIALYFSKENDIFDEKDMLVALKKLVDERTRPYLYNIITSLNFLNNKKNIEKIKQLVRK